MTAEVQAFIEAEKQAERNVAKACELLDVSRSAFYDRLNHVPSAREVTDAELTEKIRASHAGSGGTYGAPRIFDELREAGWHVGRKRVARLMVVAGLAGRCRRRKRRTTFPDPEAKALNLLARHFGPAEPDRRHHLGRRHHLRAHLGGLGLSGQRDGLGLPSDRGLGHRRPHGGLPGL